MSQKIETLADLNAIGWVSVRRIRADPRSVRVLGRRRQVGFGGAFDRVDVLVLDLAIERPGQQQQLLEEYRFHKVDGLNRADLDQCRDGLLADIVRLSGFEAGSLQEFRDDWRAAWADESAPEFFTEPGREAQFHDLADGDQLLQEMHACGDPYASRVADLLRRMFFRGGDVVRQDLQHRFEPIVERAIDTSQQRAAAREAGDRRQKKSEEWQRQCWEWVKRDLGSGARSIDIIKFVIDDWDDRPFEAYPHRSEGAAPSWDTLKSLVKTWRSWG